MLDISWKFLNYIIKYSTHLTETILFHHLQKIHFRILDIAQIASNLKYYKSISLGTRKSRKRRSPALLKGGFIKFFDDRAFWFDLLIHLLSIRYPYHSASNPFHCRYDVLSFPSDISFKMFTYSVVWCRFSSSLSSSW